MKRKSQQTENNEYLVKLNECFSAFDEDGDNYVQTNQLASMIEYLHFPLPDDFVEKTFIQFRLKDNQKFDFEKFKEFLEPQHRKTKTWRKLHDAFQVFDNDGTGKINVSDLSEILTTFGNVFTQEEINHMKAISKPDANDLIDINLITDLLVDDMIDFEEEEEEEEDGNKDLSKRNNYTEQPFEQYNNHTVYNNTYNEEPNYQEEGYFEEENNNYNEEYSNYRDESNHHQDELNYEEEELIYEEEYNEN